MSRQKIFNMIKSRGTEQNGRNAFDLSGFESYTEKCMTINPLRCIDTIPEDFFDIKINDFIQGLTPMKTAAFLRGTREIAAYYVPYNTIWHNFNQYQATREDPDSAILKSKGISFEPRLGQYWLYCQALAMYCEYVYCHYYGPFTKVFEITSSLWDQVLSDSFIPGALESVLDEYLSGAEATCKFEYLNDTLGQHPHALWLNEIGTNSWFTIKTAAGSQSIFSPYFYEIENVRGTRRSSIACDTVGNYCWADVCRKLDMLGYGNIYPVFDTIERLINDTSLYPDTSYLGVIEKFVSTDWSQYSDNKEGAVAYFASYVNSYFNHVEGFIQTAIEAFKVMCNSDSSVTTITATTVIGETYLNVYPLFAYNRCFYDMFRNSFFDLDYNVRDYNCDYLDCTSVAGSILSGLDVTSRFFKLESHQYKKDMFTGVLPDTQFGPISAISISNVNISGSASLSGLTGSDSGRWSKSNGSDLDTNIAIRTSGNSQYPNVLWQESGDSRSIQHTHTVSGTATISSSASIPNAFNVLALRRAECLQQYRMDLLRAGNKTRDIFKQIYGSSPKSEIDEAPYFIDVMGQSINVDPVIANAETGSDVNGSLGDIAARFTVRGDGHFKFSTKDFGCLLLLDYTVIDASYNSTLIDPERTILSQEGHFIPQLMNLGFSPVLGDSLHIFKPVDVRHRTIGFSLPYLEKKTYIDKSHGNLVQVRLPAFDSYSNNYVGENSIWSIVRQDMQESDTLQLRHFYGNPNILDNVLIVQYGPSMSNDQFICHTFVSVDSVRQLSELGLPRFC